MNKYQIKFSGSWAGDAWTLANVVYYNDADEVVTDTAFATQYTMPESVTILDNGNGFAGCETMTSIAIPNSVTLLEGYSFAGCSGLVSVTMYDTLTEVGNNAFMACPSLANIYTTTDNVENLKTIVSTHNTGLADLVKEIPVSTKSVQPSFSNGDIISYVTSSETVYTTELTDEGKSKVLQVKLDEIEANKQDTLVSGTSIKTINGESVLGSGDLELGGAVGSVNGQTGVVVLDAEDVGTYTKAEIDEKVVNKLFVKTVNTIIL